MNYTQDQLFNMGLIRDRRRRFVKPLQDNEHAYHIPDKEMKKYSFLSAKTMYTYLVFVMSVGVMNVQLAPSLILSVILYLALTLFEKKKFYKDKQVLKLHHDDVKVITSKEYIKSIKSNHLSELFLVSLVLILIVYKGFFEGIVQNPLNNIAVYLIIGYCVYMMTYHLLKWWKVKKHLKSM